jgi:hypothetical protein
MKRHWIQFLALGVLAGAAIDRLTIATPADNSGYHARVQAVVAGLDTMRVGEWVGTDIPLRRGVERILRPNVYINRQYTHVATGRQAQFLLIQCSDARSMLNHYPPICYPNSGWRLTGSRERDWVVGDRRLTGMEYRFEMDAVGRSKSMIVANCMLLPGGTARDMQAVGQAAHDIDRRFLGVAQVQLVADAEMSEASRDEALQALLAGHKSVLDVICEPLGEH